MCLPLYPSLHLPLYLSLPSPLCLSSSLSASSCFSFPQTVTSGNVRGIYCLPKAARQTEAVTEEGKGKRGGERREREDDEVDDDEDDDKCGRFCDIDRKQKQTNCRCAVAYVNKE